MLVDPRVYYISEVKAAYTRYLIIPTIKVTYTIQIDVMKLLFDGKIVFSIYKKYKGDIEKLRKNQDHE